MVDKVVADLVPLNGKVVTMDPAERVVEAVAARAKPVKQSIDQSPANLLNFLKKRRMEMARIS